MIKNERQYRITKGWVQKFTQTLTGLETNSGSNTSLTLLQRAEREALASQRETLQREVQEYEALRTGGQRRFQADTFEELPRVLIQARIASKLSQRELALRLGLKEQQIQRYEATEYASASLSRVSAVITALNIRVREEVFLPS